MLLSLMIRRRRRIITKSSSSYERSIEEFSLSSAKSHFRELEIKKMTRTLTRFFSSSSRSVRWTRKSLSIIYSINTKVIQISSFFNSRKLTHSLANEEDKIVSSRFWHVDNWCSKWPFALMLRRHPASVYYSLERQARRSISTFKFSSSWLFTHTHTCFILKYWSISILI